MKLRPLSVRWILLGALAIVLASTILLPRRSQQTPPPVREASVSELVRRDGRMYFSTEIEPFSGIMIQRYPSGALQSKCQLVRGVLHGVSDGWHTNGVLQVRERFHEGVSHGVRTKWFADGRKMCETEINAGKLEGIFRRWHENGSLAEEIRMKDGNPDGPSVAYHPDGSLKTKATLQNGKVLEHQVWKIGESRPTSEPPAKGHGT